MNEWNSGQQWCRGTERDRKEEEQKGRREGEAEGGRERVVKRRRGDFIAIGWITRGQG